MKRCLSILELQKLRKFPVFKAVLVPLYIRTVLETSLLVPEICSLRHSCLWTYDVLIKDVPQATKDGKHANRYVVLNNSQQDYDSDKGPYGLAVTTTITIFRPGTATKSRESFYNDLHSHLEALTGTSLSRCKTEPVALRVGRWGIGTLETYLQKGSIQILRGRDTDTHQYRDYNNSGLYQHLHLFLILDPSLVLVFFQLPIYRGFPNRLIF